MTKILSLFVFLFSFNAAAEELLVNADGVNFRSSAKFSGKSNIIKEVGEGDRIILKKDHGDYIEGTLVPDGTPGFIWKDYVDSPTTHDYYKSKSNAFPTVTPDTDDPNISRNSTINPPLCGCTNCRRTSKYGIRVHPIKKTRRLHAGCDIGGTPRGTNVYAVADGKVKKASKNGGYGNAVDIEHLSMLKDKNGKVLSNRGYTSRYAHLWKIHVSAGQTVKRGQRIGQVNCTGLCTGNHLHFEIAVTGVQIDPEKAIDISDTKKACNSFSDEGTRTQK